MNTLILVNRQHAMPEDCAAQELVPVHPQYPGILLEAEAARKLNQLMDELDGWRAILPVSGWRSKEEQTELYLRSLEENGQEFTEKYVAFPGCSEHQTGLAIDLGLKGPDVDFICPDFPDEGICRLFRRRMAAYGFVERYPAGKEHVTGIAYEPWHFRYVGVPHAEEMARRGLTLEEYLL